MNSRNTTSNNDGSAHSVTYAEGQVKIKELRDNYRDLAERVSLLREDNLASFHQEFNDICNKYAV